MKPSEEAKEIQEKADRYFHKYNEMFTLASKRTDERDYWKKACDKWEGIYKNQITEIKQLQSRIAELEEQRERLIAKLMNAEDKLKSKESN